MIREYDFDPRNNVLHVTLVSGRRYDYFGVPKSAYSGFCEAESKGRFYNLKIKPLYPYKRVRPDAAPSAR